MRVADLIAALQACDPEARVLLEDSDDFGTSLVEVWVVRDDGDVVVVKR